MSEVPPIVRLYRACEPNESLEPDDIRYVNFDEVRGASPAPRYARSLRMTDPTRHEIKLLAGHRGIGKTSELLRLKRLLERPATQEDPPFLVIFFDVTESLDINDLDFPDLLVLIAGEVQKQLKAAAIPGFNAVSTYLQKVSDELLDTLKADVNLKEAGVDFSFVKLAVELKNRPNSRKKLRDEIEKFNTSLLSAVNALLDEANVALRKTGKKGLVLLIDGLDKMVFRPLDDGHSNTHARLFCDRADQLASLRAHTVYTVPISLTYSQRAAQLAQTIGEHTQPIPMIRLRGENKSEPAATTAGMKKMWEMLEKRCACAGVPIAEVFDHPSTGHYLCRMTGGHPRHLMMFMQAAISAIDQFPITQAEAHKAVQNYANSLLREIPHNSWPLLREFKTPQANIENDDEHQKMLFYLHVFEYMNGKPWYEINPVIREIPKFHES